ncbi:serine hydrolase [Novosphingobium terrae]|uniref:serine hydrolase n=1 Tax=Novosphingobium terrae TaxID=2726189 RepID=UPI00197EAC8B|nr:serine hydrolase [Novosphingobium terrae]
MRQISRLAALACLMVLPMSAHAHDVNGDWRGVLEVSAEARLRLALHVRQAAGGGVTATLDSIDQQAMGLPVTQLVVSGDHLSLQLEQPAASYQGRWDATSRTWIGQWRQGGQVWPLTFAAARPPTPEDLPTEAQTASLIDDRIAGRPGEGIVIALLSPADTRVVARGPVGDRPPFDGHTLFEIGSLTKLFTALILADMALKGEVTLDDPAETYLPPGAHMPERHGHKITLRDLAMHRSGLPRLPDNMPFGNPEDPYADYSEKLMLDFLSRYTLPRDPGSRYEYSNFGFGLLGYLLARAAHTDYPALLAQRITGPLGLHDTVIALSPEQQTRFAQGYDTAMHPASPWTFPTLAGAGAIRSTADDMAIFLHAAMDPASVIAPAMRLTTASPRPLGDGRNKGGLGWVIGTGADGQQLLFHDGGTGGFRSSVILEPGRQRAVVVLANAAVEPSTPDLASHILLAAPLLPTKPIPPMAHPAVTLPPEELDRVAGQYAFADGHMLTISRTTTGLSAKLGAQPAMPIYPATPLSFFWRLVNAQLEVATDPAGQVTGAILIQNGRRAMAKRVTP